MNKKPKTSAQQSQVRTGGPGSRTVGVAMIVRNEEKYLPEFLKNTLPYVDQMVVVDTGSNDSSLDILRNSGVELIEIEWPKDFSKARNTGLEKITTELVLVLDADEMIQRDDLLALRMIAEENPVSAFRFVTRTTDGESRSVRMWPNDPSYRYSGAVYEKVMISSKLPDPYFDTDIVIAHRRHDDAMARHDKGKQYLSLLSEDYKVQGPTPEMLFRIGTEYHHTGKFERAIEFFERCMAEEGPFRPIAVRALALSLDKLNSFTAMIELLDKEIDIYADYQDLLYMDGLAKESLHDFHGAIELYKRLLKVKEPGKNYLSFGHLLIPKTLNGLGWSFLQLGDVKSAEKHFLETLRIDPKNEPALLYLKDSIWKSEGGDAFHDKLKKAIGKKAAV